MKSMILYQVTILKTESNLYTQTTKVLSVFASEEAKKDLDKLAKQLGFKKNTSKFNKFYPYISDGLDGSTYSLFIDNVSF